jgi:hypothetical protein
MTTVTYRFELGNIYTTPGVLESVIHDHIPASLARHQSGDWGDVDVQDKRENECALGRRLRLLSAYRSSNGVKFWIMTEADRSSTTVLLPSEY